MDELNEGLLEKKVLKDAIVKRVDGEGEKKRAVRLCRAHTSTHRKKESKANGEHRTCKLQSVEYEAINTYECLMFLESRSVR